MKSILIKDTTREEREEIVRKALWGSCGAECEFCSGCDNRGGGRIESLYQPYIEGKKEIALSPDFSRALLSLRSFMFANVYNSPEVQAVTDKEKVDLIIRSLYGYFLDHPDEIPGVYKEIEKEDGTNVAVKDWISGMTDRYALRLYDRLFVPQSWR